MEIKLKALADQQSGVFLRQQALAATVSEREVQQALRSGAWIKIRRGVYAERARWDGMSAAERHRALCHAVHLKLHGPPVVFSHVSAMILHGVPTWGHDIRTAHITRPLASARHEAGIVHHVGTLRDADVCDLAGLRATSLERALVEAAIVGPFEACVVSTDAALHRGMTTVDEIGRAMEAMRHWRYMNRARRVLMFADGRSGSVEETRARLDAIVRGLAA